MAYCALNGSRPRQASIGQQMQVCVYAHTQWAALQSLKHSIKGFITRCYYWARRTVDAWSVYLVESCWASQLA